MNTVWKLFQWISHKMRLIGAVLLMGMTLLTCVDVVGRLIKHPVFGSVELMYLMGALAVAMALPDTHATRGHIGVDLFVSKLSRRGRSLFDLCTGFLSLGLFGLVTWQMFSYSLKIRASGERSMNLELPEYLIIFVVACGFVIFVAAIIKSIVESLNKLSAK